MRAQYPLSRSEKVPARWVASRGVGCGVGDVLGRSGPGLGCHEGNVAPAMRGSGFLRNPMRGLVVCVAWQGGWENPSRARARLRVSPKPKSHLGLFEPCTSASSPLETGRFQSSPRASSGCRTVLLEQELLALAPSAGRRVPSFWGAPKALSGWVVLETFSGARGSPASLPRRRSAEGVRGLPASLAGEPKADRTAAISMQALARARVCARTCAYAWFLRLKTD